MRSDSIEENMSRYLFAAAILVASVSNAKPNLIEVTKGLGLSHKLEVELQGGVAGYGDEKLGDIIKLMNRVLIQTRDFAPIDGVPHFFTSDPEGALFPGRAFRLILTDQAQVRVLGQTVSLEPDMDAATIAIIQHPKRELVAVIRLDRLVFNKDGAYQRTAYFRTLSAMLSQIHGFWREHILHTDEQQLHFATHPRELSLRIGYRLSDYLDALLVDPRVLQNSHAGGYIAEFFKRWIIEQQQLAVMENTFPGPFLIPATVEWAPQTLAGLTAGNQEEVNATVYRALHLVQAVKPLYLTESIFTATPERRGVLRGKAMNIVFMDSRDTAARERFGMPVTVDEVPWCPSEMFVLTQGELVFFQAVFWTNQIFYNDKGIDSAALAKATVAMASEFYGGAQRYLFEDAAKMGPLSPLETVQYRLKVLQRGMTFVDALQAHALWKTLTPQEQVGFKSVRAEYESQVKFIQCAVELLKKG
jgi:hypothetical protein